MPKKQTIFNQEVVNYHDQPLFLGEQPGVARYEDPKHQYIEDLINTQLSFFWRPEEVSLSADRLQFQAMPEHHKHIFTQNISYQILLDSVQGRAPVEAFLGLVSDVSLETWVITWSQFETVHSRSYTHIIRNVFTDPSKEFDKILLNDAIMRRATAVTKYYDDLIDLKAQFIAMSKSDPMYSAVKYKLMCALYLVLHSVNVLEAIRFYVSFACSFAFAENGIMEGNAKIIRFIARDEQLHLEGTQFILRRLQSGLEGDEWKQVAEDCQAQAVEIFLAAAEQEKEWVDHLFVDGTVPGLNHDILKSYVDYLVNQRMPAVGLKSPNKPITHPLPWINKWLNSDAVQVAPQEVEISSYVIDQVNNDLSSETHAETFGKYQISE